MVYGYRKQGLNVMKNVDKNQMNKNTGIRRGRLRKWLSGFLAVSTAVTMLGGQIASFYGDETDSTYALAGEGSGEDITIHFGDGEDQDISIHVNPETGEEVASLAGLDSETEKETDNTGLEKVEAGDLVTISSADGSLLPEEAEASAEILTGKAENSAVEKVEEAASTELASETAGSAGGSAQDMKGGDPMGAKTAPEAEYAASAVEKTEYQVFEISLENVDEKEYQEGF